MRVLRGKSNFLEVLLAEGAVADAGMHRFEAHTAEVRVHLDAPRLPELFEEAGRALAEIMLGEGYPPPPPDAEEEVVTVQAEDPEALLVDWLNELIYRSDARKRVYTDIHVDRLGETGLRARIRGLAPEVLKTHIKAATFHGLEIREGGDGFTADVVLDV